MAKRGTVDINVRSVDPALWARFRDQAKHRGIMVNAAVIEALEKWVTMEEVWNAHNERASRRQ